MKEKSEKQCDSRYCYDKVRFSRGQWSKMFAPILSMRAAKKMAMVGPNGHSNQVRYQLARQIKTDGKALLQKCIQWDPISQSTRGRRNEGYRHKCKWPVSALFTVGTIYNFQRTWFWIDRTLQCLSVLVDLIQNGKRTEHWNTSSRKANRNKQNSPTPSTKENNKPS